MTSILITLSFTSKDMKTKDCNRVCGTFWCLPEELREISNTVSWCPLSGPRFETGPFCWGHVSKIQDETPSHKFKIVVNVILGVHILGKLSCTSTFWSSWILRHLEKKETIVNHVEITNKLQLFTRIYYSNVY